MLRYRVAGRDVKVTVRGTRREAEAELTRLLRERYAGGGRRVTSRETFDVYATRWLESRKHRVEPGTIEAYQKHLDIRLLPTFGRLNLRQVTRERVEAYVRELDRAGTLSAKTINDSLVPLRQIMARALREGLVSTNAAASVDRDEPLELPHEKPAIRPLSAAEARAYLDAAPDWYRPMAEVLLGTGMRLGELVALEWRDIDWDAGAIRVERAYKRGLIGTPKGDRGRTIQIDSVVLARVRDHRQKQFASGRRASGIVFATSVGTRMLPNNVRDRGHLRTLRNADLRHVRLHDLRHTAATIWLASGESVYFVQQQLGHADLKTTIGTYGHPDQAAHREAAERAAAWWRSS
jgi:integrase